MKIHGHPSLRLIHAGAITVMFAAHAVPAAPPPQVRVMESQRRNDLTAGGSFQRIGMLRQQQKARRMLEKQTHAAAAKKK